MHLGLERIMNKTIGILMAGGKGSRLDPLTKSISKHLLPIYDKPMIYYSLSTLMLADIKNIIIIGMNRDIKNYKKLFGSGEHLGMKIEYKIQSKPRGIADAFLICEDLIKNKNVCLCLGDNFFYGNGLSIKLRNIKNKNKGASVLTFKVQNPEDYGVLKFKNNKILDIIEKPITKVSNQAVTGLYFYNKDVIKYAKKLEFSNRKELEISDINRMYLKDNKLNYFLLDRGFTWLDAGNPNYLLKAAQFVSIIEERQGLKIACIEEIALRNNWIKLKQLKNIAIKMKDSNYKKYLLEII